jgi:Ca2+:H+ antiporter
LLGATLVIALCAEYLVGSVEGLSKSANISQTFIGIIILPIVGNAAGRLLFLFCVFPISELTHMGALVV